MLPTESCRWIGVIRVGHPHPAKCNPASIGRGKALLRVVVETAVQLLILSQRVFSPEVPIQREISAGIDVLGDMAVWLDPLGRYCQNPLSVHLEQVGTLPHIAEGFGRGDDIDMLPAAQIVRLVNQHLTAALPCTRTQRHIIFAVLFPDLGVADVIGDIRGIVLVLHQYGFGVQMNTIPADTESRVAAPAFIDIIIVPQMAHVSGVEQVHRVIFHQRRAGIDPVQVPGLVGAEQDGLLRPVQQVRAAPVSPEAQSAPDIEWAVLIANMILPAIPAQAIGIAHPAAGRHQVELLTPGTGGNAGIFPRFHSVYQAFQVLVQSVHVFPSF